MTDLTERLRERAKFAEQENDMTAAVDAEHFMSAAVEIGRLRQELADQPQLVARIKRSCKYWGQTAPNAWFNVRVVADSHYQLRGNNNNYRFVDVVMGVRIGDKILDFKTGRLSK